MRSAPISCFITSETGYIRSLGLSAKRGRPSKIVVCDVCKRRESGIILVHRCQCAVNKCVCRFPTKLIRPKRSFRRNTIQRVFRRAKLGLRPVGITRTFRGPCFAAVKVASRSYTAICKCTDNRIDGTTRRSDRRVRIIVTSQSRIEEVLGRREITVVYTCVLVRFLRSRRIFKFLKRVWARMIV